MKASQVLRGYLAQKIVQLPLAGLNQADHDSGQAGDAPAVPPIEVGLLPLSPGQEADICEQARVYAKSRGVDDPKPDEELYEYGKALHRCLIGVVDPESDRDDPDPFFDGGLEQIEHMAELGRDGVLTLSEMHQSFQDDVSGQIKKLDAMTDGELDEFLSVAGGPHGNAHFFSLRPGLRVSSWHFMAVLLQAYRQHKSSSGSGAESVTTKRKRSTERRGKR